MEMSAYQDALVYCWELKGKIQWNIGTQGNTSRSSHFKTTDINCVQLVQALYTGSSITYRWQVITGNGSFNMVGIILAFLYWNDAVRTPRKKQAPKFLHRNHIIIYIDQASPCIGYAAAIPIRAPSLACLLQFSTTKYPHWVNVVL